MTTIIDGKKIAAQITDDLIAESQEFTRDTGAPPCLAVVLVGDDPASAVYVRNKGKTAEKIGFRSVQTILPADTSEEKLTCIRCINTSLNL